MRGAGFNLMLSYALSLHQMLNKAISTNDYTTRKESKYRNLKLNKLSSAYSSPHSVYLISIYWYICLYVVHYMLE